jgi:hypothetical protein
MANEAAELTGSLLRSVTRMLDMTANEGTGFDSLIPVLSLVCLVSILNRGQAPAPQVATAGAASTLQKLLGDLGKGEGGVGPDALLSLLPLLNTPQMKSKINPTTISAILGLMNSMGDKGDKPEGKTEKHDPPERPEKKPEKAEDFSDAKRSAPPAAAVTSQDAADDRTDPVDPQDVDRKGLGRYLNWKNSF